MHDRLGVPRAARHSAWFTYWTGVRRPRGIVSDGAVATVQNGELFHPQRPPDLAKPGARARQEQTSPEHPARQEKYSEGGECQQKGTRYNVEPKGGRRRESYRN